MAHEPARPDQQLDQPRIGFRCGKRVGAIDQHLHLPPAAAQEYCHGQDPGFVVASTLRTFRAEAKAEWEAAVSIA